MSHPSEKISKKESLKDQTPRDPPWSAEQWRLAGRHRAEKPEKRYPVIISSSTGLFRTPRQLQEMAGLSSLPPVLWSTKASLSDKVEAAGRGDNGKEAEKVRYCEVNWEQLAQVQKRTHGENVIIWFQGKKRFAWLAMSSRPRSERSSSDDGNV